MSQPAPLTPATSQPAPLTPGASPPAARKPAAPTVPTITGASPLAATLRARLPAAPDPMLVLADPAADAGAAIATCQTYADANPASLILLILHAAPPGLSQLPTHTANAALWAFIRQAALAWAPAGTRINAIGLGATPTLPFAAQDAARQDVAAQDAAAHITAGQDVAAQYGTSQDSIAQGSAAPGSAAQGRAAQARAPHPAPPPATQDDILRTIAFIAACPSLTGQIIRLGTRPA